MRFCVIGAGNGGRAFAAYLSSKGHPVNLYNRSYTKISDIKKKGAVKAKGKIKGSFPIDLIRIDLELAIKDVDVILVVIPASGHKDLAKKIAPYLTQDQIILLNPGRTFGAIEFHGIITRERGNLSVFIAETQTLLFTSRQLKKNKVEILKIKDSVDFSAFPEKNTFFIYDTLKDVFPQLNPVDDYLEVTLRNIGMLLHPVISLLNAGSMNIGREFKFYKEGATSRICEVLEFVQLEINKIFNVLGLKQFGFCEWVKKSYGVEKKNIYDAIQHVKSYENIKAPNRLNTRYFTEDVPTGLVPLASLGDFLGINTPIINSIINLTSILCGTDFKKEGRTIDKLEIKELITRRIVKEHEIFDLELWQKSEMDI